MNPGTIAATTASTQAATAAAAAAERRRKWEEEVLTTYSQNELNQDWEFKILHSARGAFRDPQRLREVLDEEARAGWVLLEKFDNSRIRLKRSPDGRHDDSHLGIDPWRSFVGSASGQRDARTAILIAGLLLAGVAVFLAVLIGFAGPPG